MGGGEAIGVVHAMYSVVHDLTEASLALILMYVTLYVMFVSY